MRHKLTILIVGILFFVGCGKTETINKVEQMPEVTITKIDAYSTQLRVNIKPNDEAVTFKYAIGSADGRDAFRDGSMDGIVKVNNGDEAEIAFEDLNPDTEYTVFAMAYNEKGEQGPVASLIVRTFTDGFNVGIQYITANSAGFRFNNTMDYYKLECAIGLPGDRAAFEAGTIRGMVEKYESTQYTANFFDLEPDTEYIMFARGYDRMDRPTIVFEVPIKTYAEGACPGLTFTNERFDVYEGLFTYTPNSQSSFVSFVIGAKGYFDPIINDDMGYRNDLMQWLSTTTAVTIDKETSLTYQPGVMALGDSPLLECDYPLESYALIYDKDGYPFGVQKIEVSTPSYDENLPKAEVTVNIKDITTTGATYEFVADDNTVYFYFDTINADWYDDFKANDPEWHDDYLRDMFRNRQNITDGILRERHNIEPTPFTETEAVPGARYYVAVCPMNGNGVSDDAWGELYLKEYYTVAE
jgi:hypothetical protein